MHPFLTRLQVKPEIQKFFHEHHTADIQGNLIFPYGDVFEHFGFAFHKVPVSTQLWLAGNLHFSQVRRVIICYSAMEAISWLNKNYPFLPDTSNLLFLATGARLQNEHIRWINSHLPKKNFFLVFGKDILGRMADLKLAAGLRRWPVDMVLEPDRVSVSFRSRAFNFNPEKFSLNAFEKASGYRFRIPAHKPKAFDSFFDELKANAGFTL